MDKKNTWFATINVRGTKIQRKREEIEKWMKDNEIMIAAIQETRAEHNTRETRKNTHDTLVEKMECQDTQQELLTS